MRRFRRPAFVVPTLAATGVGGRRRAADLVAYQAGQAPSDFPGHWTRADVKGLLHAMQGWICGYCNRQTNGLDVEHFRPKGNVFGEPGHGGYWWLADEASNYFFGCTVCNQKRKSNRFPLVAGAVRVRYETRLDLSSEKRILLDPVEDPVEDWLAIEWDDLTAEMIPNPALGEEERKRVQEAIDFFGLNTEPEVRAERSRVYEQAVRAASEGRWTDLAAMAMRHEPHSFVARFVLLKKKPEMMPSEGAECAARLEALGRDLLGQVRAIQKIKARGGTPVEQDMLALKSLAWGWFVLWNDPAGGAGAAAHLQSLLAVARAEERAEILEIFRRLAND